MTVVPASNGLIEELSTLKLARYAQIIQYGECAFWGIYNDQDPANCRVIWSLAQRQMVAKYLYEAQLELEDILNYPIGAQWIEESKNTYTLYDVTKMGYLIEAGIKAVSNIHLAVGVAYVGGNAVTGVLATTVTNEDEIHVYHPGTDVEIDPSEISLVGGNLIITIPKCRMVKLAYVDNPDVGWAYNDEATWGETTVDIKRVYNDPSTNAILTSNHTCGLSCALNGCTEYQHVACIYITNNRLGHIEVYPAAYSNGWSRTNSTCCYNYKSSQLYYKAGRPLNAQLEDCIIRLAHSKMPKEPCGCDPVKNMWTRDRNVPLGLTAERINCPFGLSDGAWAAWSFAKVLKLVRGGLFD